MNSGIEGSEKKDLSEITGSSKKAEPEQAPEYFFSPGTPKIIRWLIKHSGGLIKNEKQANRILLAVGGLLIIVSIALFFVFLDEPNIPPEALEEPEYGVPEED